MPEPPSHAAPTGRAATGPARHGRAPVRESASDAAVRRRAVRHAALPAGIVAVVSAAVTAYALASTEGSLPAPRGAGLVLWCVLGGGLLLICVVVAVAAHIAASAARSTTERYAALRRAIARNRAEVRTLVRGLEEGERLPQRTDGPPPAEPGPEADTLDHLAYEVTLARRTAEEAIGRAAAVVESSASGSEERVEVFVNLSRRLQSLVHREIALLDDLENKVEDPDLLKSLFHLDHLTTRIRRHAENLAVLGGAVSRRQWNRSVTTTEVLRSAIAEVEDYSRVKLVPPVEGTLRGHAVADVIHLLAELVENATVFSAPQTQVMLRAQHVTAGLAIEVEDRGLGMTSAEQNRMNAVLADPDRIDVGELLKDGRIGLFVVSALARRHGIVVQLQSNIYGGIQAVLVLPRELLGEDAQLTAGTSGAAPDGAQPVPQEAGRPPQARPRTPAPAPAPASAPAAAPVMASAAGADGADGAAGSGGAGVASGGGTPGEQRTVPGPRHAAPANERADGGTSPAAGLSGAGGQADGAGEGDGSGRPKPLPRRRPQSGGTEQPARTEQPVRTEQAGSAEQAGRMQQAGGVARVDGAGAAGPPPISPATGSPATGSPAPGDPASGPPVTDVVHGQAAPGPAPVLPRRKAPAAEPSAAQAPSPAPAQAGDRAHAPAPAQAAGQAPGQAPDGDAAEGARPPLPRRRRQEHLAPELRVPLPDPRPADDGSDRGHNPGLMAAFQRGTSLAEDTESYDDSHTVGIGGTAPASGAPDSEASTPPAPASVHPEPAGTAGPPYLAGRPDPAGSSDAASAASASAASVGDVPRPAR